MAARPFFCFHLPERFRNLGPAFGEVTEWSIVPDSKSGVPQGTVGSNPTLSASLRQAYGWQAIRQPTTTVASMVALGRTWSEG